MSADPPSDRLSAEEPQSYPVLWVLSCVVLAAVMCGLVWHGRAFIVAGSMLLLIITGLILPYLSMRGISARMLPLDARGQVGRPLLLKVVLENRNWWAWGTTIVQIDEQCKGTVSKVHRRLIPRVERNSEVTETWQLIPTRRGKFPAPTQRVSTRFPFGVITASKPFSVSSQVIIWPEIVEIDAGLSGLRFNGFQMPQSSTGRSGDQGDISGPRPYRPGESLRRVHWRHTARQGELIVCEREAASAHRLRLELDVRPEQNAHASHVATEIALSVGASLIWHATQSDWHVDLTVVGGRHWDAIDRQGVTYVLDWLAMLDVKELQSQRISQRHGSTTSSRAILVSTQPLQRDASEHDEVIHISQSPPSTIPKNVHLVPANESWRDAVREVGEQIYV